MVPKTTSDGGCGSCRRRRGERGGTSGRVVVGGDAGATRTEHGADDAEDPGRKA